MLNFEDRTGPVLDADRPAYPTNGVPEWYRDAKLGIFVHWGIYSVPAWAVAPSADQVVPVEREYAYHQYAEWYANTVRIENSPTRQHHRRVYGPGTTYEDLADHLGGERFDPSAWTDLFREAGARYVVPGTKHHDGFCLWSTATTPFNSLRRGPGRDVIAELADAARDRGLRLGLYYSGALDWHVSDFPAITSDVELFTSRRNDPEFAAYAAAQLRELVRRFRPDVLWNDIDWPDGGKLSNGNGLAALLAEYFEAVPDGVVNDRWGVPYHGFLTREYTRVEEVLESPWEACRGIGRSFGHNTNESEHDALSVSELVRLLVDVVSKNGNLLLNVGPRADGTIPELQVDRLRGLGAWLAAHGEAIHGTRPWPAGPVTGNVRCTIRDDTIYLHVLDPSVGAVELPSGVRPLGWLDGPADVVMEDAGGSVTVPEGLRDRPVAVIRCRVA